MAVKRHITMRRVGKIKFLKEGHSATRCILAAQIFVCNPIILHVKYLHRPPPTAHYKSSIRVSARNLLQVNRADKSFLDNQKGEESNFELKYQYRRVI